MARTKRTETELRKASEHLAYEIWMFQNCAMLLSTGGLGAGSLANAVLEACIIHFRILMEFFYPGKRVRDDTVICTDFKSNWSPPEKTPLLDDSYSRAHKEAAHLTYNRQDVTDKDWQFVQMVNDMQTMIHQFSKDIPEHLLSEEWKHETQ